MCLIRDSHLIQVRKTYHRVETEVNTPEMAGISVGIRHCDRRLTIYLLIYRKAIRRQSKAHSSRFNSFDEAQREIDWVNNNISLTLFRQTATSF